MCDKHLKGDSKDIEPPGRVSPRRWQITAD